MTIDSQFPDDENGDVLRQIAAAGVDLVSPRVLAFEHCFPNAQSAKRFYDAVSGTVLEARLIRDRTRRRELAGRFNAPTRREESQ